MLKQSLGKFGEAAAKAHLEDLGFEILETSWRLGRTGEIDLIAYKAIFQRLAFIEVKTRRSNRFGTALEAITPRQQIKIRMLAEAYLAANPQLPPYQDITFDLMTVTPAANQGGLALITHYEAAF